jgi:hypothetical protein
MSIENKIDDLNYERSCEEAYEKLESIARRAVKLLRDFGDGDADNLGENLHNMKSWAREVDRFLEGDDI